MNKTLVIWIKALGAFFIPFATTLGVGIKEFGAEPNRWALAGVLLASGVAGYTGLNSFLSRSYADHQDEAVSETQTTKTVRQVSDVPPAVEPKA